MPWRSRSRSSQLSKTTSSFRAALADADVPALLPALVYITGDFSLLRDDLRIDPALILQDQAGLTPEQLATARQLALETLIRFRDNGSQPGPPIEGEALARIVQFMGAGLPVEEYMDMAHEELALTPDDERSAHWRKQDVAPDRDFLVAVIGAGMSGIVAAYRLEQAGVPYVVIDKNEDVGGSFEPLPTRTLSGVVAMTPSPARRAGASTRNRDRCSTAARRCAPAPAPSARAENRTGPSF